MWDYKKMKVWVRADVLAKEIHKLTLGFPKFETYELGSQMRRSAGSIPDNIAEGSCKSTSRDFINYLNHSKGSARELESQIGRAVEAGYVSLEDGERILKELMEIVKMICGVARFLKKK
jgi:four helix bundle protein